MTDRADALDASIAKLSGGTVDPGATPSARTGAGEGHPVSPELSGIVEPLHIGDGIACGVDDAHTHGTVADLWRDEPTGVFYVALVDPVRRRDGKRMVWTPGARLVRAELLDPATLLPAADRRDWLRKVWRGLYSVVGDGKGPLSADEGALLGYAREIEVASR